MPIRYVPNALSLFRIFMVPVLGVLAWQGLPLLFLGALALSLGSDVVDGWVARRQGVTSPMGARLDSWGDLATYAALPLFAWWLWPDLLRAEWRTLACALFAYTLPMVFAWARFGRLSSYHTWGAKLTAVVMGVALFVLFLGGPTWLFQVATFLLLLEAFEEIAISWVLPRLHSDVPTLWHAVQVARHEAEAEPRQSPAWRSSSSSGSSFAFTVRRSSPRRRAASS